MNDRPTPTEDTDEGCSERRAEVQRLLDDAEARDEQADVRDTVAAARDNAGDLESFLNPSVDYDALLDARRAAARDRTYSKGDRLNAADDRSKLATEHDPSRPAAEE